MTDFTAGNSRSFTHASATPLQCASLSGSANRWVLMCSRRIFMSIHHLCLALVAFACEKMSLEPIRLSLGVGAQDCSVRRLMEQRTLSQCSEQCHNG
jgi:hypothetical protein